MNLNDLMNLFGENRFYTGVPDSQLCSLCNYLMSNYGISSKHIIAVNEGNCVGIAAGYYLSTGNIPIIYMQNSGLGNIINPYTSLLHPDIYGIPCIFIIGWRGEPNIHDEPQHKFQGKITLDLLEILEIEYIVLAEDTTVNLFEQKFKELEKNLKDGKSIAIVVKKNSLKCDLNYKQTNTHTMSRETAIKTIIDNIGNDVVVSTTGKISRELYEIRKNCHSHDFLTVGSMGHCSSIALGIALNKPDKKVWCLDGDGSLLMHMGSMATIGTSDLNNLIHVILNNESHESVGGYPTKVKDINLLKIAEACKYKSMFSVSDEISLQKIINEVRKTNGVHFIEVKVSIGSRENLGRPKTSAMENKEEFMKYLGV